MANFPPFSTRALCRRIRQGSLYLSGDLLKKYDEDALNRIGRELEKTQHGIREEPLASEDLEAVQGRGEEISRVRSAILILESYREKRGSRSN